MLEPTPTLLAGLSPRHSKGRSRTRSGVWDVARLRVPQRAHVTSVGRVIKDKKNDFPQLTFAQIVLNCK